MLKQIVENSEYQTKVFGFHSVDNGQIQDFSTQSFMIAAVLLKVMSAHKNTV